MVALETRRSWRTVLEETGREAYYQCGLSFPCAPGAAGIYVPKDSEYGIRLNPLTALECFHMLEFFKRGTG